MVKKSEELQTGVAIAMLGSVALMVVTFLRSLPFPDPSVHNSLFNIMYSHHYVMFLVASIFFLFSAGGHIYGVIHRFPRWKSVAIICFQVGFIFFILAVIQMAILLFIK